MKYILGLIFIILSLSFVFAIPNDAENKIDFSYPSPPINYSLIATVNSSDFWDDLDVPTDIPNSQYWYNQTDGSTYLGDQDYVPYTGKKIKYNKRFSIERCRL